MTFRQPTVERRDAQPYVGLATSVTMDGFGVVGGLFGEVFAWLGQRGVEPVGPPFLRFLYIDMERQLDIHVAVPVAEPPPTDERVLGETLPAGRWVVLTYEGGDHLGANAFLQAWALEQGLRWKNRDEGGRERWGGRTEITPDPADERDDSSTIAYLVDE